MIRLVGTAGRTMIRKAVLLGTFAVCALLSTAAPAVAAQHHPRGIFAHFGDCPLDDPAVTLCMVVRVTGGELILGRKTVPIDKPVAIQAGLIPDEPESREYTLAGAEDGETLSRTRLSVPGGLTGTGVTTRMTEVTATLELAGPPGAAHLSIPNVARGEGVGLRLPVMAKLNSLVLGGDCRLGSASSPIVLELTSGTTAPPAPNKPLTGKTGEPANFQEGENLLLELLGASLVDNGFSAPRATGCGPYAPIVNTAVGLPSPAGRNTAILAPQIELATTTAVKASE